MADKFTIHVAGPVEENFQGCANCRTPLIDYRNAVVMSMDGQGPSFWPEGKLIGVRGNMSFVVPVRPLEADEELCDEDAFGLALC